MTNPQATVSSMFAQSVAVLTQPSVQTFERFETRGGVREAYIYVALAALVSAVIAGFFGLFQSDINPLAQFVSRILITFVGFGVFTGLVYFIGKSLFKGTGTYAEVAYTFALFFVPVSILSTVIGIIPILGALIAFLLGAVNIYFGWLAVQSSMNIRQEVGSIATLILSGIGLIVINGWLAGTLFQNWVRGLF